MNESNKTLCLGLASNQTVFFTGMVVFLVVGLLEVRCK